MAITVICPNLTCRSLLQVTEDVRGKKVRCGRCGRNFRVPPLKTPSPANAPGAKVAPANGKA